MSIEMEAPSSATIQAMSRGSSARSCRQTTAVSRIPGHDASAASTSASSTRTPRIFTWPSARPSSSSTPPSRHRARSPVAYIRAPHRPTDRAGTARAVRIGSPDVATRHAWAADVELASHTGRYRNETAVEDVGPHARQRATDRHRGVARGQGIRVGTGVEAGAVDGRLGQAVGVDHPGARRQEPAEPPEQPQRRVSEPTASRRRGTGVGSDSASRCSASGSARAGTSSRHVDAVAADEPGQLRRVEQDLAGAGDERAAGRQGADPVAGEHVEGEGCRLEVPERRGRRS